MTIALNIPLRNLIVDTVGTDLLAGVVEIYDGVQPAANDAPAGTLLVTCTGLAYGASAVGIATSPSISGVAVASGTAQYARQRNAGSTNWMYGSVTAVGGGGDVEISSTSITISGTVTINNSTLLEPES